MSKWINIETDKDLSHQNINACINGGYDLSRWITISRQSNGNCVLRLTELCLPGKVSSLGSVAFPIQYLKTAVFQGALQITLPNGFLCLRRSNDLIQIEFKGMDEVGLVKADFQVSDFAATLSQIEAEETKVALSV